MTVDMFSGEDRDDLASSDWAKDLVAVLTDRGVMRLDTIYREMYKLRKRQGRSWPTTAESTVRCTLQRHSKGHPWYQGPDLFVNVMEGVWKLK